MRIDDMKYYQKGAKISCTLSGIFLVLSFCVLIVTSNVTVFLFIFMVYLLMAFEFSGTYKDDMLKQEKDKSKRLKRKLLKYRNASRSDPLGLGILEDVLQTQLNEYENETKKNKVE